MNIDSRPDLSNRSIVTLLLATIIVAVIILIIPLTCEPGSSFGQASATLGALLLLAPAIFSIMKRSGFSATPPTWFVIHVLLAMIGSFFIFAHVHLGDLLTPPGFVLFLLVFLLLQGSCLRVFISARFGRLFARNSRVDGFGVWQNTNKETIQTIIDQKIELLESLDDSAQEALFSPALKHWLRHPVLSYKYQRLIEKEATLVGARQAAGKILSWSRRIHMLVGALFYFGLIFHIVIVLFFAGYAAGDEEIYWWYITDWGR